VEEVLRDGGSGAVRTSSITLRNDAFGVELDNWIKAESAAVASGSLSPDDALGTACAIDSLRALLHADAGRVVMQVVVGDRLVGVVSFAPGWLRFVFVERTSRGKGYAIEAASAVLRRRFDAGDGHLLCKPDSVAGRALAGSLGFVDEGDNPWCLSIDRWSILSEISREDLGKLADVDETRTILVYAEHEDDEPLERWPCGPVRIGARRPGRAFGYFPKIRRWYWFDEHEHV